MSAHPLTTVHLASGVLMAGAEAMLEQLCLRQTKRPDLDVQVFLLNEGALANRLRKGGIEPRILDESVLGATGLLRETRTALSRVRPDVVHTHDTKENLIGALASVAMPGCAGIRTIHGQEEYPGEFWHLLRRLVLTANAIVGRWLQHYVVTVSPDLANRLPRLLRRARVRTILNGVDPVRLKRAIRIAPARPQSAPYRLVYLGRLMPVKRVHMIIEALEILEQRYPGQYSLEIIGEGYLRPALEEQASRGDATITFYGFRQEPLDLLAGATALVLASEHEGLPMAVLEALSLGVPAVVPAVWALPDILTPTDGCVVEGFTAERLAEAIVQVAENRQSYQPRLPGCCRVENMEQQYYRLYRDLIDRA